MTQAIVNIDGALEAEERYGALRGLKTEVLVYDIVTGKGTSAMINTALAYLTANGYAYGSASALNSNLILVNRIPSAIKGSDDKVKVVLEYIPAGECEHNFVMKVRTTIKTIQSGVNAYGQPYYTTYTYPADYPFDPTLQSVTCSQGNMLSVTIPSGEIRTSGIVACDDPQVIQGAWVGAVNSKPWMRGIASQWCCTGCESVPWDVSTSPPKHMFNFTFEYDQMTWWSWYYFIDQATGKPPADLIYGTGYKPDLTWHPFLDFNVGPPALEG